MPTICMFRGIKIYINWNDHMPPHFHAVYAGNDILVSIDELEVIEGEMPSKQQKNGFRMSCISSDRINGKLGISSKTYGFV